MFTNGDMNTNEEFMDDDISVNQLNKAIQQGKAPKTIIRIDPANPPRYDRYIHAHFTDGSALYINGEWKHPPKPGSKVLTNDAREWLTKNGWKMPPDGNN
ncbi:hypothetical protein I4U23_011257 [Adineta vaga]|nr:hypothetical protein I4U23_011257 [Adineta vaga]